MNLKIEDYHHLVHDVGYVVLDDWTIMSLRGADRAAFLQNLCTNDVLRLQPGDGCEAFFTDVKGHVLALVVLLCREDETLLWTVPGQASQLLKHLEKYIIREDVVVRDASDEARLVVLTGAGCEKVVGERLTASLDRPLAHTTFSDIGVVATKCPWFGENAFVCQCATDCLEPFETALKREGAIGCDRGAVDLLRIECGTPFFGVDFDASNLPQEVNRNDAAISFTKGCYLGQETVARIDALGHVNRLLVQVRFDGRDVPPAGTALLSGDKEVGKVTSACWSPGLSAPLALAMVRRGNHEPGTALDSSAGSATVAAASSHQH